MSLAYTLGSSADWFLSTATRPNSPFPQDPRLVCPEVEYTTSSVDSLIDPLIRPALGYMRGYALLLNDGVQRGSPRRTESEYQKFIFSLHYRLVWLQGVFFDDAISECLRLTMLALLTTTLQIPGARATYPDLASRLREQYYGVLADHQCASLEQRDEFLLWSLLAGAVSVFDVGELSRDGHWMRDLWEMSSGRLDCSWEEMRLILGKYVWINGLHDGAGSHAFEFLANGSSNE